MKVLIYYIPCVLFSILYSIDVSTGCSCTISADQKYCDSELVLSLKATGSGEPVGNDFVFPISVLKVNKNKERLLDEPIYAMTDGDPLDSCRQLLDVGKYYIMSGILAPMQDSPGMRIFSCDLIKVFNTEKDLRQYKLPKKCPTIEGP